jgi:hypothetical protein
LASAGVKTCGVASDTNQDVRVLLCVVAASVAAGLLSACGGSAQADAGGQTIKPKGDLTLEEARNFAGPPLYFVGEEFEGLPLTAIVGKLSPTFIYGTCEIPAGSEGGCAPPLSIQHWSLSERHPGRYAPILTCRRYEVRGVPAAAWDNGGLDVYTGDRTVVIFGDDEQQKLRAAEALRQVNGALAASDPLPAPNPALDVAPALGRCTEGTR